MYRIPISGGSHLPWGNSEGKKPHLIDFFSIMVKLYLLTELKYRKMETIVKLLYLSLIASFLTSCSVFAMDKPAVAEPQLMTIEQINDAPSKYAAIKELFDEHDGLRPNDIKRIIADYCSEGTIKILLKTPEKLPWLFGCMHWRPYYPPIKSLQFKKDNILEARAPGTDYGYNFVMQWNLINGSCTVNHTGFRPSKQVSLRSYKIAHKSFGKDSLTDSHHQLVASVKTQCVHAISREPEIIFRKKHVMQLVLPSSLILTSVLLGKSYTECNKSVADKLIAQIPQA